MSGPRPPPYRGAGRVRRTRPPRPRRRHDRGRRRNTSARTEGGSATRTNYSMRGPTGGNPKNYRRREPQRSAQVLRRAGPNSLTRPRPARHAAGNRWFVDETYVKVAGRWTYLYRSVDQHGQVIDVLVARRRDATTARACFTRAWPMVRYRPRSRPIGRSALEVWQSMAVGIGSPTQRCSRVDEADGRS
jgi:hypothetical protein